MERCWSDSNPCRQNEASAAIIDRFLYIATESCKLYYCYDVVMGCGVQQIWLDLSAASVERSVFDTFCNNMNFSVETLQCLDAAEQSCDAHTPDGISSVVDMFRVTIEGICDAGVTS